MQAIITDNDVEGDVKITTTVNVNPSATSESPPLFNPLTYSATVFTGISAGSFVPGLNMIVTDTDIVCFYCLNYNLFYCSCFVFNES